MRQHPRAEHHAPDGDPHLPVERDARLPAARDSQPGSYASIGAAFHHAEIGDALRPEFVRRFPSTHSTFAEDVDRMVGLQIEPSGDFRRIEVIQRAKAGAFHVDCGKLGRRADIDNMWRFAVLNQ